MASLVPGRPMQDEAPLDAGYRYVDLLALTNGPIDVLGDPAVLSLVQQVDGHDLIRGHATFGRGMSLLGARSPSLELVRISASGILPLGLNAGQTRLLASFPDDRHYESGIAYLGAPIRDRADYLPYQLPIVDLASGEVVGVFGATRLRLWHGDRLDPAIAAFQRQLLIRGEFILDASFNGHALMVLTLSGRGNRSLVRLGQDGMTIRPLCTEVRLVIGPAQVGGGYPLTNPNGVRPRIGVAAIDRHGNEVQRAGLPIVVRYSVGQAASDVVIYFHGGPGSSVADRYFPEPVARLVHPGRDLVSVEYSGSQGGGLTLARGIADKGMSALAEDVDALTYWLRRRHYRRVFVLSDSFGGVPAVTMVARHRALVRASFFSGAVIRLLNPADWVDIGNGLGRANSLTQRAYENTYLGAEAGRQRVALALDATVRAANWTPADVFFFGENDPISRPSHLPAAANASRRVIPGAAHVVMLVNEQVWSEILRQIE